MQKRAILSLAIILSACSGGEPGESAGESEAPVDTGGVAATITSAGPPESCAFAWDGQPITPDGIIGRAVVVVGDAIDANGGVENMVEEDLPLIRFEAVADAPFHCTSLAIGAIRATGFTGGTLRIVGSEEDVNVLFEIAGIEGNPPRTVAALDDSGAITMAGRSVEPTELGNEIVVQPDQDPIVGTGTLFLLPSANTPFEQVFAAADTVFQSGGRATLASCYNPAFDLSFAGDQIGTPLPEC